MYQYLSYLFRIKVLYGRRKVLEEQGLLAPGLASPHAPLMFINQIALEEIWMNRVTEG